MNGSVSLALSTVNSAVVLAVPGTGSRGVIRMRTWLLEICPMSFSESQTKRCGVPGSGDEARPEIPSDCGSLDSEAMK